MMEKGNNQDPSPEAPVPTPAPVPAPIPMAMLTPMPMPLPLMMAPPLQRRAGKETYPWPLWLEPLLSEFFHGPCILHGDSACNYYCLDCRNGPMCPHCLESSVSAHQTIQIHMKYNRYAVVVSDIEMFLDVSFVSRQMIDDDNWYIFLKKPDERRGIPIFGITCLACNSVVRHEEFRFCSIGCMVAGPSDVVLHIVGTSRNLDGSGTDRQGGNKRGPPKPSRGRGGSKRQRGTPPIIGVVVGRGRGRARS